MPAAPRPEDVRRIAAVESPVLRNLLITRCYARLSAAVAASGATGANWCTFATWASRQAGRTIRGEDAQALVTERLRLGVDWLHPLRSLWRALLRRGLLDPGSRLGRLTAGLRTPFDALERASDAVARGNRKVFEEIGFEFARYLRACPPGAAVDDPAVVSFLEGLRPGDPPEGQGLLRQAFRRYQAQRSTADAAGGPQAVLLANLEIGLHEQTRLQPEIREALDAAHTTHEDLGRRLLELLLPRGRRIRRATPDRVGAAALGAVGARIQGAGDAIAREVITEALMVLTLPGRVLALGHHLPDPFPDALRDITDPELAALLARYEPEAAAEDDCGAEDWSVLEQRMHYIAHLFRALHARPELFDAPFTPAQERALEAGRIPDGVL